MLAENDRNLTSVLPLADQARWDLVHALRFRGWLCDNLGLRLPAGLSTRIEAIDTTAYTSAQHADTAAVVRDLLAVSTAIGQAAGQPETIDCSVHRPYFKPTHRHLADWVLFMAAHDAWHLGRASTHRVATP